ncbi:unnamed protein product [Adineta ricciae]|uniref:Uncharacterized protein n=1 Tax=Adineta ricciae TaxID=249248 RepID=A0A816CCI7_ADIRI|nr:unnamed protein product [Adineta ricciae]
MAPSQIEWNYVRYGFAETDRRKYCIDCHSMLSWTCVGLGKSCLYTNCYHQYDRCSYGTPELDGAKQQEFQVLNNSE